MKAEICVLCFELEESIRGPKWRKHCGAERKKEQNNNPEEAGGAAGMINAERKTGAKAGDRTK